MSVAVAPRFAWRYIASVTKYFRRFRRMGALYTTKLELV